MGRLLEIFRQAKLCEISEVSEISSTVGCARASSHNPQHALDRFSRLFRNLQELERRCPFHVHPTDWQRAVEDGRTFLARWGVQAQAFGWTARELFGLHPVQERPAANYRRLSRYDETGLIWLLRGRAVVALTATEAAIQGATGVLIYRKQRKPAPEPAGDSLDRWGTS